VVCRLAGECTHGRRVVWCERRGQDLGEAMVGAGLARDCLHFSGGEYAGRKSPAARRLPLPDYCHARPDVLQPRKEVEWRDKH
jgi:hypothetical protein